MGLAGVKLKHISEQLCIIYNLTASRKKSIKKMYIVLQAILVLTPSENLSDKDDTHCENGNN